MKIEKILRIEPANDSIYPEILFRVQFSFPRFIEIPNSVSGILYCNQTRIGVLNPYYNLHSRQFNAKLPLLSEDKVRVFMKKQNPSWLEETLLQEFSVQLDKKALDFIESVREKDREKCARLQVNFEMQYFSFTV